MKEKIKSWLKIFAVRFFAFLPKMVRSYFLFDVPTGVENTQVYCNNKGLSFSVIRSQEQTAQKLPETPEADMYWEFSQDAPLIHTHPDVWIAEIPRAYVVTQEAHILTPERQLLTDASIQFGLERFEDHKLFHNRITLPKYKYFTGTSTIVSAQCPRTYFHWVTDALPRIGILHQAGLKLSEIDRFLVPKYKMPIMQESLQVLGVEPERCEQLTYRCCFQAETLILPSPVGVVRKPAPWVRDFLQNSFLKAASEVPDIYPRRFFICRKKRRQILNESEILPILESHNIQLVQPEKLSFVEQVALFARAELVVAPHGAGLTNLIFSPPTTSVVEIFSPNYINLGFWRIANLGGLRYSYLEGEGERPPEGYRPNLVEDDIHISPQKLKSWLDTFI